MELHALEEKQARYVLQNMECMYNNDSSWDNGFALETLIKACVVGACWNITAVPL